MKRTLILLLIGLNFSIIQAQTYSSYLGFESFDFKKIVVEQNTSQDGQLGISIHIKMQVSNLENTSCAVAAFFWKGDSQLVKPWNKIYNIGNGYVSAENKFVPKSEERIYNDMILFIPYSEFKIYEQGKHRIKVRVTGYRVSKGSIRLDGVEQNTSYEELEKSDFIFFYIDNESE